VEAPAFQSLAAAQASPGNESGGVDDRTTSSAGDTEMIEQLLIEQLRDRINAEGQLVKALPKMVKAQSGSKEAARLIYFACELSARLGLGNAAVPRNPLPRPSFNALQNYGPAKSSIVYYVFDVMVFAGRDEMRERWERAPISCPSMPLSRSFPVRIDVVRSRDRTDRCLSPFGLAQSTDEGVGK
jgi:hypothetical protein